MKIKEIRDLPEESLALKLKDLAEELFNLKFQHAIRPLENTGKLQALKKDIARVQTVITERRIVAE